MVALFNPNRGQSRAVTPEGHAGPNVFIPLPFYANGFWSPSGRKLTFLTGEIIQRKSRPNMGLTRPDTFRKDASSCPVGTAVV